MSVMRQRQGRPDSATRMAVSKRFGMYKKEEKVGVRKAEIKEDQTLGKFSKIWRKVFQQDKGMDQDIGRLHSALSRLLKRIEYSHKDVEKFSLMLADFPLEEDMPGEAGLFLSALINNGKDSDYVVHAEPFGQIDILGFRNRKSITLKGNGGVWIGTEMKGGKLIVEGDVDDEIGGGMRGGKILVKGNSGSAGDHMKGGEIMIEGNAGAVGNFMEGGRIIVKGNATLQVGDFMEGGEIVIEGEISSIEDEIFGSIEDNVNHGKIYHKGKLIVDK